jgi:hypothetical protein
MTQIKPAKHVTLTEQQMKNLLFLALERTTKDSKCWDAIYAVFSQLNDGEAVIFPLIENDLDRLWYNPVKVQQ